MSFKKVFTSLVLSVCPEGISISFLNAKEAIKGFGQDLAMDGSIAGVGGGEYAVQKRSVTGGPINMIADRPLFIDSTGKILSQKQIKTLRQAYVGSQQ